MNELLSAAIGTFILILFGCGVNAGISLNKNSPFYLVPYRVLEKKPAIVISM